MSKYYLGFVCWDLCFCGPSSPPFDSGSTASGWGGGGPFDGAVGVYFTMGATAEHMLPVS